MTALWKSVKFRSASRKKNDENGGDVWVGLKRLCYRALVFSPMTLTISEVIDTNTPVATCTVQDLDM